MDLVTRGQQSIALTPDEVVDNASHQAKLLMDIVNKTHCYQEISGKKYLQVEAWETIGAFNRVHAVTESITPIERDKVVVGYDAKVNLLNQVGLIVGGAIMSCYFTENACKGKVGDAKDKACKSAAQTFATSKAYRMNYSYVAILAGYQPTPAEEMTGESTDDRPANLEHWCEEHKTKFFKRGKMKGYAHNLPGGGWCNEDKPVHTVEQVARDMAEATTSTLDDGIKQGIITPASSKLPKEGEQGTTTLAEILKSPGIKEQSGIMPQEQENKGFRDIGELLTACAAIRTADFPKGISKTVAMNIWAVKEADLAKLNLAEAWEMVQDHIK